MVLDILFFQEISSISVELTERVRLCLEFHSLSRLNGMINMKLENTVIEFTQDNLRTARDMEKGP